MNDKVKEFREELAKEFIRSLQEDDIPWLRGWRVKESYNMASNRKYHGINRFMLALSANMNGWTDPRWLTFNQAREKGLHLKKGSKATKVEYWYPYDTKEKRYLTWNEYREKINGKGEELTVDPSYVRLVYKIHYVFNAAQFDGIDPIVEEQRDPNEMLGKISESMNVALKYDSLDRAFYMPLKDEIHLPTTGSFYSDAELTATALHELAHATGHPSRLDRDLSGSFGSESYAKEELRAEIASAFMGVFDDETAARNIIDNHKAYIQSWIKAIKDDPNALIDAIKDAEQISSYLSVHAGLMSQEEYKQIYNSTVEVFVSGNDISVIQDAENLNKIKSIKASNDIETKDEKAPSFKEQKYDVVTKDKFESIKNGNISEDDLGKIYAYFDDKDLYSYIEIRSDGSLDAHTFISKEQCLVAIDKITNPVSQKDVESMDDSRFLNTEKKINRLIQSGNFDIEYVEDPSLATYLLPNGKMIKMANKNDIENIVENYTHYYDKFADEVYKQLGLIEVDPDTHTLKSDADHRLTKAQQEVADRFAYEEVLSISSDNLAPSIEINASKYSKENMQKLVDEHQLFIDSKGKTSSMVINVYGDKNVDGFCNELIDNLKAQGHDPVYLKSNVDYKLSRLASDKDYSFSLLKDQMLNIDEHYGVNDLIVVNTPLPLNSMYLSGGDKEYETGILDLYKQYNNFHLFVSDEAIDPHSDLKEIENYIITNRLGMKKTYGSHDAKLLNNDIEKRLVNLNKKSDDTSFTGSNKTGATDENAYGDDLNKTIYDEHEMVMELLKKRDSKTIIINLYGSKEGRTDFSNELVERLIREGSIVLVADSIANYLEAKGIDPNSTSPRQVLENKIINIDSELLRVDANIDYIITHDPAIYTAMQTGADESLKKDALKIAKSYNQFSIVVDRGDEITENLIREFGSKNRKDGIYFGFNTVDNISQAVTNLKNYKERIEDHPSETAKPNKRSKNYDDINQATELMKKDVSIIDIAKDLGFNVERISSNIYTTAEHDSLRFFKNTNSYSHFSRAGEPNSQGDIFNFVMGYAPEINSYYDAIRYVSNKYYPDAKIDDLVSKYQNKYGNDPVIKSKKTYSWKDMDVASINTYGDPFERRSDLARPAPSDNNDRIKDYLINQRGIDERIVDRWISKKLLYEDKEGNCVFVGYAGSGPVMLEGRELPCVMPRASKYLNEVHAKKISEVEVEYGPYHSRYMSLRATDPKQKIQKRDVAGSQKIFGIWCNPEKTWYKGSQIKGDIYFTESAIDAMSLQSMLPPEALEMSHFISLQSASNLDCVAYWCNLYKPMNQGDIQNIYLAFDNDQAGYKAFEKAEEIIKYYYGDSVNVERLVPRAKDFNEELINMRIEAQKQAQSKGPKQAQSINLNQSPMITPP